MKLIIDGTSMKSYLRRQGFDCVSARQTHHTVYDIFIETDNPDFVDMAATAASCYLLDSGNEVYTVEVRGRGCRTYIRNYGKAIES